MQVRAIITAAGTGKRMNSKKPKVLHEVGGIRMISRVINNVRNAAISEIYVIIGESSEAVKEILPEGVKAIEQQEQLGTTHAVKQAAELIDIEGESLV